MNIDLSEHTFVPELVHPCKWNGTELEFGCVFSPSYEFARVAKNSAPTQLSQRVRENATVFLRCVDSAFSEGGKPKVADILTVRDDGADGQETEEDYRILNVRRSWGGVFECVCEVKGSRTVTTSKTGTYQRG